MLKILLKIINTVGVDLTSKSLTKIVFENTGYTVVTTGYTVLTTGHPVVRTVHIDEHRQWLVSLL